MNELLALNKKYLLKGYAWISGILTISFSCYLFFFFSEISIKWILIIYSITLLFAPLYVVTVIAFDWFNKRKHKKRILNKRPYNELEKIGFTKKILKVNYNYLKDYVVFAEINGCQIVFDINDKSLKTIEFTIYCNMDHLTNKAWIQKSEMYLHSNIELTPYAFIQKINTKKETLNSIQELERKLVELTHIVKKEKGTLIPIIEALEI